jgi:3-oxoadipate enol-lactonase
MSAATLVFLHGLGTGPAGWQPQVDAFGRTRVVLTPRLRLDRSFTVRREAERLSRDAGSEPVDICGLSLGALVALRAALDRPERVRRLVLCAGLARLPISFRLLQTVLGGATVVVPDKTLRDQLLAGVPEPHRADARREIAGLDGWTVRHVFREARRFDVLAELQRLTMPVLVLVGESDRANRRLSRALAESIPTAAFSVIPGAGHVANLDAPAAFNEVLGSFLEGEGRPSSPMHPEAGRATNRGPRQ